MEVPRRKILGNKEFDKYEYLLTDARNPLGQWQKAVAVQHSKCKFGSFVRSHCYFGSLAVGSLTFCLAW